MTILAILNAKKSSKRVNDKHRKNHAFDEVNNDPSMKRHRKYISSPDSQVDCWWYKNVSWQLRRKPAKVDPRFVLKNDDFLDVEAKVDDVNTFCVERNSSNWKKYLERLEVIERENCKYQEIMDTAVASDQTRIDLHNFDWEVVNKPRIIANMKYGVPVKGYFDVDSDEFEDELENPPTRCEYQKSDKIRLLIYIDENIIFGTLEILIYDWQHDQVIEHFKHLCKAGFKYEKVHKIFRDLAVELRSRSSAKFFKGDEKCEIPDFKCHEYLGSVSIPFDVKTKMLAPEFIITMKKTRIFDERNVVVGRVVKGLRTLQALNEYGTKFGNIHDNIYVTTCD